MKTEKFSRILRRSLNLALMNTLRLRARTLCVSLTDLTVVSPMQLVPGQTCKIDFDILIDGSLRKVSAISKTADCVCVGLDGFRARLEFIQIDKPSRQSIIDWLRYGT